MLAEGTLRPQKAPSPCVPARGFTLLAPGRAIGNVHALLGRLPDGLKAWERALRLDATLRDARQNVIKTLSDQGRHAAALEHARAGAAAFPTEAQALVQVGDVCNNLRDFACSKAPRPAPPRPRRVLAARAASGPAALALTPGRARSPWESNGSKVPPGLCRAPADPRPPTAAATADRAARLNAVARGRLRYARRCASTPPPSPRTSPWPSRTGAARAARERIARGVRVPIGPRLPHRG
jgi:tetratricopeptide (TPR) repeat protein